MARTHRAMRGLELLNKVADKLVKKPVSRPRSGTNSPCPMNHPTEKHAHRNPWQKYTGEKTEWVCGFCDEPMNQPECAALTKKNPTMTTREIKAWKEGVFKLPDLSTDLRESLILRESWRKQRARLQQQHPTAKIKYSYKTKQFRIIYSLPRDFFTLKDIKILKP